MVRVALAERMGRVALVELPELMALVVRVALAERVGLVELVGLAERAALAA